MLRVKRLLNEEINPPKIHAKLRFMPSSFQSVNRKPATRSSCQTPKAQSVGFRGLELWHIRCFFTFASRFSLVVLLLQQPMILLLLLVLLCLPFAAAAAVATVALAAAAAATGAAAAAEPLLLVLLVLLVLLQPS